jgi:hypothetical protein
MDQLEVLVEVYTVTEYRDGDVYRTKTLGKRWVPLGTPLGRNPDNADEFFGALSTSDPESMTPPRRVRR